MLVRRLRSQIKVRPIFLKILWVVRVFKPLFRGKIFVSILLIFWFNYFRHPFNFETTNNLLIIAAFFYLPLGFFFFFFKFFQRISRFFAVPLSILGLFAVLVALYFTSPVLNANVPVVRQFGFFYSLALPLGVASLFCLFISIPAYFRLIFRRPPFFMFSVFSLLLIFYAFTVEYRLYSHLERYNKFFCSYQETKRVNSPKVVRIEGLNGEGSGFFVEPGMVITNKHVVEGEEYPKVVLSTGEFLTPTKVEISEDYDLAFLTVDKSLPDYVINLDRAKLAPGEEALSFGYALGSEIKGAPTILPLRYENDREIPKDLTVYLQFSSAMVFGMSGGPVFDKCGNFVGVNVMSTSGTSLVISPDSLERSYSAAKEEPEKLKLEPGTSPEASVYAYYYLLKARDTKGCYELLSESYKTRSSYEEWTARFPNVINVEIYEVKEIKPNLVYVLFVMDEWVEGERQSKGYEGTWQTIKEGDAYHLKISYILEIPDEEYPQGPEFFLNPEE